MSRRAMRWIVPVLVLVFVAYMLFPRGAAPRPNAFADSLTLEQATQRSAESGKPVLVFATADWCGPCQHLKRTTLADERVASAINQYTEPVYMDLTNAQATPEVAAEARAMDVRGIPALILLRDGRELSRRTGAVSITDMVSWLESS